MALFLICYDIRCPRRLQQVHRAMLRHATPIEYSIFLLEGSSAGAHACLHDLQPLMADEDDVRCYPLPAAGWQERLGLPVLPVGICWTALPTP